VVTRVNMLGDEIAGCEDEVIDRKHGADMRARLANHHRRAIQLRRFLAPQREALGKPATISLPWLDAMQRARVIETADRMTRTVEELDAARDRAALLGPSQVHPRRRFVAVCPRGGSALNRQRDSRRSRGGWCGTRRAGRCGHVAQAGRSSRGADGNRPRNADAAARAAMAQAFAGGSAMP
jgi:hypothetical protein